MKNLDFSKARPSEEEEDDEVEEEGEEEEEEEEKEEEEEEEEEEEANEKPGQEKKRQINIPQIGPEPRLVCTGNQSYSENASYFVKYS